MTLFYFYIGPNGARFRVRNENLIDKIRTNREIKIQAIHTCGQIVYTSPIDVVVVSQS